MKISLLHATRRPKEAQDCQKLWLERAENASNVEIITCIDHDDLAGREEFPDAVLNSSEGVCPAWNEAAKHATGDVLIAMDDDWQAPHSWDQIIESYMCNGADILHVGDKHRKDQLICHPIISRKFYESMGYLWHPLFKSVYCDNWFSEVATRWGYVDATDGGKIDLGFVHANPSQGYGTEDDIARKSNSRERYAHGEAVYRSLQSQTILAFTVAGRREYLQQTLKSWLATDLSLVSVVHFFIEPIEADSCSAEIDTFAKSCPVPVIKHFNKEKLGVLRNPWHLFDHCFRIEGAKFVILGEDDFLVSPDVLSFLTYTRTHWNNKTLATCAKWVGKEADNNPVTFHRSAEFTGNIWMTGANSWNRYLRDTWDFDYSSGSVDGTPSGWDWNIQLRVIPNGDLHCVVPTASRSKHIGITGIHCTEEVFSDTVAWNFLEEPYFGEYREKQDEPVVAVVVPTVRKSMTHAGDLGDVIVSLATLHDAQYLTTIYLVNNGQTKGIVEREHIIRPLLDVQPYIESVEIYNGEGVDWRSEGFRGGWVDRRRNLANCHAQHAFDTGFIAKMPDLSKPWLFNIEPDSRANSRIVVNRSARYQNQFFPWREVVANYGSLIIFIGTTDEHRDFCNNYGVVEYVPTANLLEAARLIKGSDCFIANQSSCMTIAEGLKHPRILEGSLTIPDCIYQNAHNAQYVFDGSVELPAVAHVPAKTLKSNAISWSNFDITIVPKVGRGYGWIYDHNGIRYQEGTVRKTASKVAKLLGISQEQAEQEVIKATVKAAPNSFGNRLHMSNMQLAKSALEGNGYKEHPVFKLASGNIADML
jgi:hypothetical protein